MTGAPTDDNRDRDPRERAARHSRAATELIARAWSEMDCAAPDAQVAHAVRNRLKTARDLIDAALAALPLTERYTNGKRIHYRFRK